MHALNSTSTANVLLRLGVELIRFVFASRRGFLGTYHFGPDYCVPKAHWFAQSLWGDTLRVRVGALFTQD
jgi:hypothetical protein